MTVQQGYDAASVLVRTLTERVEVAEANYFALETMTGELVEALGFDIDEGGPMIEDIEDRACKLMALAQRLVRLDDVSDPGGVEDRRTVALTDLINQAKTALGVQEGDRDG